MKNIITILLLVITTVSYGQQVIKPHQVNTGTLKVDKVNNRIGIGTTTPTQQLDVVGKIALNDGGNSVYIGDGAGSLDDGTDNRNVGVGYRPLYSNTSGFYNIASGYAALYFNTTGNRNTAYGYQALYNNTTGSNNVGIGYQSLYLNTGSSNVGIGYSTLSSNTSNNNVAIGYFALTSNGTGNTNTSVGSYALMDNTTGFRNSAFGGYALYDNTIGNYNTGIGMWSLSFLIDGSQNTALGYQSGRFITGGISSLTNVNNSVYIGSDTKGTLSATNENVFGYAAEGNGSNSVTIGNTSITKTVLNGNVGIGTTTPLTQFHVVGSGLFSSNLTVNGTTLLANNYNFDIDQTVGASQDNYILTYDNADGQISLEPAGGGVDFIFADANRITIATDQWKANGLRGGTNSITIGSYNGSSGADNVYIGNNVSGSGGSASGNTVIGTNAGTDIEDGINNVLVGAYSSISYNTSNNVVIGNNAKVGDFYSSADNAVVVGYNANALADNSIAIGYGAYVDGDEGSVAIGYGSAALNDNSIALGPLAVVTQSNTILLGNSSITRLYCYDTSISSPSDARDKTNVESLVDGLDFVNTLRPVAFQWLMREGTKQGINDVGFIAQELYQSQSNAYHKDYLDLADYNVDNDTWFAQYANLIPVYAKAIQDLDDKIETQQQEINNLQTIIQQLTIRLETLENQ